MRWNTKARIHAGHGGAAHGETLAGIGVAQRIQAPMILTTVSTRLGPLSQTTSSLN